MKVKETYATTLRLRAIFLATVLAVATLLGACNRAEQTVEAHLRRAQEYAAQGKGQEALIEMRNVLQKAPEDPRAHLMLADMFLTFDMPEMAEVSLIKARDHGVSRGSTRILMARSLYMQGKLDKAIAETEDWMGLTLDGRLQLMDIRAQALLAQNKHSEGCALFMEMERLRAGYVPSQIGLVLCSLREGGRLADAENVVRSIVNHDANNAKAWTLLGDIYFQQGKSVEAELAYRNAIQRDPLLIAPRGMLVTLYLASNKIEQAEAEAKSAASVKPTPRTAYLQALVDYQKGNYQAAKDRLEKVLGNFPDYWVAVRLYGAAAYQLRSYELAAKNLSRYLAQAPQDIFARKTLVLTQTAQGSLDEAINTLQPLLREDTQDPTILALAGEVYLRAGQPQKSIDYLQRALALAGDNNVGLLTQLGRSYLSAGQDDRGIAMLEKASRFAPKQTLADTLIINHYIAKRDYDAALAAIAVLQGKMPGSGLPYFMRGIAYLGKHDHALARKSFEQSLVMQPGMRESIFRLAQLDITENKLADARRRYQALLEKNKSDMAALFGMASVAYTEKNYQEQEMWLKKAANSTKQAIQPRVLLTAYYMDRKDIKQALATAREAVQYNPSDPRALELLGQTQIAAKQLPDALVTYSKLIQILPKSADVHYKLGTIQAALNRPEQARGSLRQALALRPDHLPAARSLVMLELGQGHPEAARAVAAQLRKHLPNSPAGHEIEGDILLRQGMVRDAALAYARGMDSVASADLLVKWHKAMILSGQSGKADARVLQWLSAHPEDTVTHSYLAASYMLRGMHKEAMQQYEKLLERIKGDPPFLPDLAWLYLRQGDPRALAMAQRAHQASPENVAALDILGWVYVVQGQAAKGLPLLERAASKADRAPTIRYHLAVARARLGDRAGALRELEQALKAGKGFPEEAEARRLAQELQKG